MKFLDGFIKRFLFWRVKNLNSRQFLILVSIFVGLAVGLGAVVIKNTVHFIQLLLVKGFPASDQNYLYIAYPTIGILLAILFMRFIIRGHVGHGIPSVLYAISKEDGRIKRHNIYSSIVTSSLTVGFGGSVGLEGPTVATGAAIGSNLGRMLRLNYKEITLLLGCACAGAMASIFKAPIAAIVFALEVIMIDLTAASVVPLLFASASAALTSYFFMGQEVLYHFEFRDHFSLDDLPFYIVLGVIAAFISVYFTKMYIWVHSIFEKIKKPLKKLFIGGAALGLLIFLLPGLYGEGYEVINSCLAGNIDYLFNNSLYYEWRHSHVAIYGLLIALVVFKVVATSITFGAGGIGGIFAPTLFMGANLGLVFAMAVNHSGFFGSISGSNFALVGMAGCIAGVLHAPLTAIFLIAEITGGYELFMPLMIVSVISYATAKAFAKNSVYTYQLAKRGELMTHHKDKNILALMRVESLIETNFKSVDIDASLGELVKVVAKSKRNVFPVLDKENNFYGVVTMDHIRNIMFSPEKYNKIMVRELLYMPPVSISPQENMEAVAKKFHESDFYNIVVLDDGKYQGFVSRANVFSSYRKLLKQFSDE